MLFYWFIWFKLGLDDAHHFMVYEKDLWILLGLSLLVMTPFNFEYTPFFIISVLSIVCVHYNWLGSADRDVLMIMALTQSFHSLLLSLFFSLVLALFHALVKQKKVVPLLYFLSLGHFLNFCLKTL